MGQTSKGKIDLMVNAGAGTSAAKIWAGGRGMLSAEASWGGGNIKLQMKCPNGTYADVPSSTLSANGHLFVDLPQGEVVCVAATGSAFYVSLVHIPL